MKMYSILTVALFGSVILEVAAYEQTNLLTIGGETVNSKVINGKIVGDKWLVVSNVLIRVHAEVTPISKDTDVPGGPSSTRADSNSSVKLLFRTGDGLTRVPGVKGFHGVMYMLEGSKMPSLGEMNIVDIYSSADNSRIVLMVAVNGPVYSSTNSGITWAMVSSPGKYELPLEVDLNGDGFVVAATIRPNPENQIWSGRMRSNWYAIGSAQDGSRLILAANNSRSAPALSIIRSSSGFVVSWPITSSGFVLQANDDLSSTNWVDVKDMVETVGQENQVVVSSLSGHTFYRLRLK